MCSGTKAGSDCGFWCLVAAGVVAACGPSQLVGIFAVPYHGISALSNKTSRFFAERQLQKTINADSREKIQAKIEILKNNITESVDKTQKFAIAMIPVVGVLLIS